MRTTAPTALALALALAAGCGASPAARRETTTPTATAPATPPPTSYASPSALTVSRPETQVLGVDGANVMVRMRVIVTNMNPYPVTARTFDGVLYLDGAQAATVHVEGAVEIAARTDQVFQLDASVPIRMVMGVRSRVYTTSGAIAAATPDGTAFSSPFSFDGPLPAL